MRKHESKPNRFGARQRSTPHAYGDLSGCFGGGLKEERGLRQIKIGRVRVTIDYGDGRLRQSDGLCWVRWP